MSKYWKIIIQLAMLVLSSFVTFVTTASIGVVSSTDTVLPSLFESLLQPPEFPQSPPVLPSFPSSSKSFDASGRLWTLREKPSSGARRLSPRILRRFREGFIMVIIIIVGLHPLRLLQRSVVRPLWRQCPVFDGPASSISSSGQPQNFVDGLPHREKKMSS